LSGHCPDSTSLDTRPLGGRPSGASHHKASPQLFDVAIGAALLRVNRLAFVGAKPHHLLSILLLPSRSRILLNHTAEELAIGDTMAIAHDCCPKLQAKSDLLIVDLSELKSMARP
jgi:hypothetical protein